MRVAAAAAAGVVFGVGLAISEMVNPAKVLAFLDLAGHWDPSLALVMGGGLVVAAPAFAWARRASARPLFADGFQIPERGAIDGRLLGGAAIFGVGWGLGGLCPGPALAGLAAGEPRLWIFVLAMAAGALVHDGWVAARSRP
ncbi:MAG: YeeE/YedE family protein [Deltaproteobacteria bacterium]|nr:YeeE/YedE family protein [Deltaproteobacteria bacterium]